MGSGGTTQRLHVGAFIVWAVARSCRSLCRMQLRIFIRLRLQCNHSKRIQFLTLWSNAHLQKWLAKAATQPFNAGALQYYPYHLSFCCFFCYLHVEVSLWRMFDKKANVSLYASFGFPSFWLLLALCCSAPCWFVSRTQDLKCFTAANTWSAHWFFFFPAHRVQRLSAQAGIVWPVQRPAKKIKQQRLHFKDYGL